VAWAFSARVRSAADFLWVARSASCCTRAALIPGTNFWRLSYSPRNAACCASSTSLMSALWKLAKSAASCTIRLLMPTAWGRPSLSWRNMSPNAAALASASWRGRPIDRADPRDQRRISAADPPKMTLVLLTVSLRSEAALVADRMPRAASTVAAASPAPITSAAVLSPAANRRPKWWPARSPAIPAGPWTCEAILRPVPAASRAWTLRKASPADTATCGSYPGV